jgi:hypothetical protein
MIAYTKVTKLHLQLEKLTNRGLNQERAIELIKTIPDPGLMTSNLRAYPDRINHNVVVETHAKLEETHHELVEVIEDVLEGSVFIDTGKMTISGHELSCWMNDVSRQSPGYQIVCQTCSKLICANTIAPLMHARYHIKGWL